jgi:hypothetical protein
MLIMPQETEGRLRRLQKIVRAKGGKCLSKHYLGVQKKLLWQCAALHRWEASPLDILRGSWCQRCYWENLRLGIEVLRVEAGKRGGECLALDYDTVEQKLEWRCSQGHVWRAKAAKILEGAWRPDCANDAKRLGLEKMREAACQRGGECLSEHYERSDLPLKWRCLEGEESMPAAFIRLSCRPTGRWSLDDSTV